MASYDENKKFAAAILPGYLLDAAVDWILDNMEPEDVFDEEKLKEWALANGFVESDE